MSNIREDNNEHHNRNEMTVHQHLMGVILNKNNTVIYTTILSSIGARSNQIDHVTTQLPYALICAGVAAIGYLVLGLTESVWL